ncbi:DNA-binding protein [Kribbella sp. NPDC026611]|uniref:DNA-binding protein n=1 Tax=Kribbella sp. NPDC026611 TaxID=3154911 RepID=UPI0033FDFFD1
MDQTAQNLQQQIELYGEPLGDTVRRIVGPLMLTQGGLAQLLGLSAPMLSQLVNGQRVKIGNPGVLARLRAASELADLAIQGEIDPEDIADDLERIRVRTGALTSGPTTSLSRPAAAPGMGAPGDADGWLGSGAGREHPRPNAGTVSGGQPNLEAGDGVSARTVVRAIQDLLRDVSSADEIQRAAAMVAEESPDLAELLLVYGTGKTADALAHYKRHHA